MKKTRSLQSLALSSAIASILIAGAWAAPVSAAGAVHSTVAEEAIWIVTLPEAGIASYRGDMPGLARTAPDPGQRLNPRSAEVSAYRQFLASRRADAKLQIHGVLSRSPEIVHDYAFTHNGFAMRMTEAEAHAVEGLLGPGSVERDKEYELATFRGPTFIGADNVWALNLQPEPTTSQGRGVVIAVLDTGIDPTHPSFANDTACGFSSVEPKLRSYTDCSRSTAGACSGSNPSDTNGHGTHVASTAGGNTLAGDPGQSLFIPPPFATISGVAPCATIRSYKVCAGSTCAGNQIIAGINNVLQEDDIDVVNFSISGGESPWNDNDRAFLDVISSGVFVAAAAGNMRDGDAWPPVNKVNHRGPWVMTVAASTHDQVPIGTGTVSAVGPGTPPTNTQNIDLLIGGVTTGDTGTYPLRHFADSPLGCENNTAYPSDFFDGAIALISRGTCSFEEKINHAAAAGAEIVFVYNNEGGTINMAVGSALTPAYSMLQADGNALLSFISANAPNEVLVNIVVPDKQGNVLADFSYRGPMSGALAELTKPDVTAPGVDILAAVPGEYGYMSGTSMASPHVAGAAALVKAVHPDWTPTAIKTALQMTAERAGTREDFVTAWTLDDVGHGLVRPDRAINAGLVLEETKERFLAANPSAGTVRLRSLNLPSLRRSNCTLACGFYREFTSTLDEDSTWNATWENEDGTMQVQILPSTFTIPANGTQTIGIKVEPQGDHAGMRTGHLILNRTDDAGEPLRFTVAIEGEGQTPDHLFVDSFLDD